MVPPLPPGMEIVGWSIWLLFLLFLGVGILIALKSVFPNIVQQKTSESNAFNETMRELLQEIKMLRREIEELRKELKE